MSFQTSKHTFGTFQDHPCFLYEVINAQGVKIHATDYGAKLVGFFTPDRNNHLGNIVVGFNSAEDYCQDRYYFGATVGRVAGRISQAKAQIQGQEYHFAANNGSNTLHGGVNTIDKQLWNTRFVQAPDKMGIEFSYLSPNKNNGFPGNLSIKAYYWLTHANELIIEYTATTDKATIVNLTNHSYYNLTSGQTDICNHELKITAEHYLETDNNLLPTGRLLPLAGSPLQFTDFRKIDACIQALTPRDLDHSFVVTDKNQVIVDLRAPESGCGLKVYSNQKSAQIFTSKNLTPPFSGLAIEMQNFADAVNHPNFPSTLLVPGEEYHNISRFAPYIF